MLKSITYRPTKLNLHLLFPEGCMQLDVSGGTGITYKSFDYFLGLGISI